MEGEETRDSSRNPWLTVRKDSRKLRRSGNSKRSRWSQRDTSAPVRVSQGLSWDGTGMKNDEHEGDINPFENRPNFYSMIF